MTLEQKLNKVFSGFKSSITITHSVRIVDGQPRMRICWKNEDIDGFYEGFEKIEDCLDNIIIYLDKLPDNTLTEDKNEELLF